MRARSRYEPFAIGKCAMPRNFISLLVVAFAVSFGCVTTRTKDGKPVRSANSGGLLARIAAEFEPAKHSWNRVTKNEVRQAVEPWKWCPVVPVGVTRAELASCNIRAEQLANWLPKTSQSKVQLVSHQQQQVSTKIAFINGQKISNFADLTRAVNNSGNRELIQIDFQSPSGTIEAIEIPYPELNRLSQFVEPELAVTQYTEDSNPWFLIRDGDVRCRGTVRVERTQGIAQVVLALSNVSSSQTYLLPTEITAVCDEQPLQFLTVDQCLDQLYANNPMKAPLDQTSFAVVSDREDYLLPTNYRALENELGEHKSLMYDQPAFALVNSEAYPGTALLGDARALSQFLLRRERLEPNAGEITGWLIMSSATLKTGKTVKLRIDLGRGPREILLRVP